MTILNKTPLNLTEVKEYIKDIEENKVLQSYLKKFSKLKKDNAKALAEEIKALNNLKIKNENIVKIIDFLPKDQEDINKIFTDVSLSEEEANAIIEIVKKY